MSCNDNILYTSDDIQSLQDQIQVAIKKCINKEKAARKKDLAYKFNQFDYTKLIFYSEILEKALNCNPCLGDTKIEDVVSKTKTLLNNI